MDMAVRKEKQQWTYKDYMNLPGEVRLEVFDGDVMNMVPAPTPAHQRVQRYLLACFSNYLSGKTCEVFGAPIDVCLFAEKETAPSAIKSWVQPDLLVVCDKEKIGDHYIVGAPDLVIEILSPSTAKIDRVVKFHLYETAGVREYWIVDPLNEYVETFLRGENGFALKNIYANEDTVEVGIFPDLQISLNQIFMSK